MTPWQRRARLVIAIGGVAFAIVVAVAFKRRASPQEAAPAVPTDPRAVVESTKAQTIRVNREHEDIRIGYDKLLSYPDGTSKMLGVRVVTQRAGGREITISGNEGQVGQRESDVTVAGDVRITSSDGTTVRTDRATYSERDGISRAPGRADFERGRIKGSGVGLVYDKNRDVLTIAEDVAVAMAPGDTSAPLHVNAATATFDRGARTVRFERAVKALRGAETIESDTATVHLSTDEQRMELLELRGHSRITPAQKRSGDLQAMQGRDIDMRYGADGQTLQHVTLAGEAVVQFVGDQRSAGRRLTGGSMEISMGPDGSTPTAVTAKDGVELTTPSDRAGVNRTVTGQTMESQGDPAGGLRSAIFTGNVEFRERGGDVDRIARSGALELAWAPGSTSIDEAKFSRAVRFEQRDLRATSTSARYLIEGDKLQLTSDSGSPPPHLDNERISIDATLLDVVLDGPHVKGSGAVKSVLRPASSKGSQKTESKMPAMLKQDQPVNVTAENLDYDGAASRATYTGKAQLWQGETTLKGDSIVFDDKTGDLTAVAASTRTVLLQEKNDKSKEKERVLSTATAKDFKYEEKERRATYSGEAHLNGPQGDMKAEKIELYLKASGDELERLEAYESVSLVEQSRRKTSGARLTYFSADERYVMVGTPVTITDECGRETTGRTLTFYKATDRIIVDGNEQTRTQTKGKSNCP